MEIVVYKLKNGDILIVDYYREDDIIEELEGSFDLKGAERYSDEVSPYCII